MSKANIGILERISSWAASQGYKAAWTFLDDFGKSVDSVSYLQLDIVTDELAAHLLKSCGLKPGDRALLVFFPGLDFMITLLACFKAQVIAVPVFPPDPRRLEKDMHHFVSIQSSSGHTRPHTTRNANHMLYLLTTHI